MQYMIPGVAPKKIFLGIHVWEAWSTCPLSPQRLWILIPQNTSRSQDVVAGIVIRVWAGQSRV
jgi:hypothetical protein